mmetsp:Transcript_19205/g.45260  ORF Transcript_19205/g.45260 Transcript_19205/m.45260 type:complete len:107 (-) Transcript_19205:1299-1619(-)
MEGSSFRSISINLRGKGFDPPPLPLLGVDEGVKAGEAVADKVGDAAVVVVKELGELPSELVRVIRRVVIPVDAADKSAVEPVVVAGDDDDAATLITPAAMPAPPPN